MSLGVFLAVLFAAFLHAAWNALVKLDAGKLQAMLIMTLVQGALGLTIALLRPFPSAGVWPWLIASGAVHSLYKFLLAYAYTKGDLSRVYPIARGAAPMLVALGGVVLLPDAISTLDYLGIGLLGLGVVMMSRGVFTGGEERRLLPFAIGSAVATACYSVIDGLGARVDGDAVTFVAWMFALDGMIYGSVALTTTGTHMLRATARTWALGGAASVASYGAYAIAVWAMTQAPIQLVTALRETSILFAVLIGWLVFKDRMDGTKAFAAALILAGVAISRLSPG
ncbi:DMT family transporter [Shimia biformata]|uniref:DMT family transporter n=1 Tax=Shimia biformata TaxID=1294299 RepID=UPI00194EEBCA|nr:DMT family transporter [Shimia biformata]